MSIPPRRTQAARNAATRAALIGAARQAFAAEGYAATAIEAVVAAAGVTRGALYHHFADKKALFAAVAEMCAGEVSAAVESAAAEAPDPHRAILAGSYAFLHAALAEDRLRILLIDAPAALGWAHWREIDARHSLRALKLGLREAGLKPNAADSAAHLISGALNEAALTLAAAPTQRTLAPTLTRQIQAMIAALLPQA